MSGVVQQVSHGSGHQLDADDQPGLLGQVRGKEAHTAVGVQHRLVPPQVEILHHQAHQLSGLGCVDLEEGWGGDAVRTVGHDLRDVVVADQVYVEPIGEHQNAGDRQVDLKGRRQIVHRLEDEHALTRLCARAQREAGELLHVEVERSVDVGQQRVEDQAFIDSYDIVALAGLKAEAASGGRVELGPVAVGPARGVGQGRVHQGVGDAPDAPELVGDDLGLETQLSPVVDVLPLATPAAGRAEVGAGWRDTVRGGFHDVDQASEGVASSVLADLGAHRLARQRIGDEDDALIVPTQGCTAMGDGRQLKGEGLHRKLRKSFKWNRVAGSSQRTAGDQNREG